MMSGRITIGKDNTTIVEGCGKQGLRISRSVSRSWSAAWR